MGMSFTWKGDWKRKNELERSSQLCQMSQGTKDEF